MKRLASLLIVFALLITLVLPLRAPLQSIAAPPHATVQAQPSLADPQVTTASARTLDRLAPDLRLALQDSRKASERRLINVQFSGGDLATVERLLIAPARSKLFAGQIQWVVGEARLSDLAKIASAPGVYSVTSQESFQPLPAPGLDEIRGSQPRLKAKEIKELLAKGGDAALRKRINELNSAIPLPASRPAGGTTASPPPAPRPATVQVTDVHNSSAAAAQGHDGDGVVVALVDTGVDFANADLTGTDYKFASGPYAGWPVSHNILSGINYARNPEDFVIRPDTFENLQGNTWYVGTLPIPNPVCNTVTCTAPLTLDPGSTTVGQEEDPVVINAVWPDSPVSDTYYYSVHPDYNLTVAALALLSLGNLENSYLENALVPPALVVADTAAAGTYDTVYVDSNFNADLTDDDPQSKAQPVSGFDAIDAAYEPNPDGFYDLSAGMLAWIADGVNPPPGTSTLYEGVVTPEAGRLLVFFGDEDSHGTNCASDIVSQSVITDPYGNGPINPRVGGYGDLGEAGGPVMRGMAQDAKLMAFQNAYFIPDAWVLSAFGFDGVANTGDEAQIVSNSFGFSDLTDDGWNPGSRIVHLLNNEVAPNTTWLVATGNGGHGYGTVTMPTGDTIIDVGASTSYGTLVYYEDASPDLFTYGDVQPWSNRGPGASGDLAPDVVAVGAWGTGANPLNLLPQISGQINGQSAYDLFGGTSMSTPIAAGVLAQVYDAFKEANNRFPTYQEATDLLLVGAYDLGYDPFTQGSGNVDALRSTAMATGDSLIVTPSQWYPGDYRGTSYPGYINLVAPGDTVTQVFTLTNPTASQMNVSVDDLTLQRLNEYTRTVVFTGAEDSGSSYPHYLLDMSEDLSTFNPDLLRVQAIHSLESLDSDGDYTADDQVRLFFYNWLDRDSDNTLWDDLNSDGFVSEDELEPATEDGEEFNRFSFAYNEGNYQEINLGRTARELATSDGVFFGLQRRGSTEPLTVELRFTYYDQLDWEWSELSNTNLVIPAGASRTFTTTVTVPQDIALGAYQAVLQVREGGNTLAGGPTNSVRTIPIVTHVAANSASFAFGAATLDESLGDQPYSNGHVYAAPDWGWRPETGDWRTYYYDVPASEAITGTYLIAQTDWADQNTDIDTLLFGADPNDPYVAGGEIELETDLIIGYEGNPGYFGPAGMQQIGGSNNTNINFSGAWEFETATGGSREVVAGELKPGLGLIELHQVQSGGSIFGEAVVGSTYLARVDPAPISTTTRLISGSLDFDFSTTATIAEGLAVRAFGFGSEKTLTNQPATQDDPEDILTSSYVFSETVTNGGLLEVRTTSNATGLDVDLYLARDGGDGLPPTQDLNPVQPGIQNDDALVGSSFTITADEFITVEFPDDGLYWGLVHGYGVPANSTFDLTIINISGNDLSISGIPGGAVAAGNVDLQLNYQLPAGVTSGQRFKGLVYIGPSTAPTTIRVPVEIQYVANNVPTLDAINRLGPALVNEPYTITYEALAAAANEADADNDGLIFRITAVSDGTLTKSGAAVVPGTTTLGPGESLVYTPSRIGAAVNAFAVVAVDTLGAASAAGTAVTVEVRSTTILVYAPIIRLP
jgi:hypothetical protein